MFHKFSTFIKRVNFIYMETHIECMGVSMSTTKAQEEEKPPDYLMWVGGKYYTIQSFIREAKEMGVSRRVPIIPDIVFGKTRIFFISDVDENDPCVEIKTVSHKKSIDELKRYRTYRIKRKCKQTPKVFGYFIPTGILVPGEVGKNLFEKYRDRLVLVPATAIYLVPLRGCGRLVIGAIYLVDGQTLKEIYEALKMDPDQRVKDLMITGSTFQEINPPIQAQGVKRFRGLKRVDGDAILSGKPVTEWWVEE